MAVHPDPILSRRGLIAAGVAGTATLLASPCLALAQPGPQDKDIIINRARVDPIPIAVPAFGGEAGGLGSQISGVVAADLARCGLFRIVSGGAPAASADTPEFSAWKAIGSQALVTGRVDGGGGSVKVQFRLWDVLQGQQIQGTEYTTTSANWRRIAHIVADVIYERMLGEKGYFDTRIVYIAGTGPRGASHKKRLAIMDQDSANNRFLTDGAYLTLTPRFHPTRDEIAFMSYANNRPRVYLFNLGSGRQQVLGEFDGMTFAPRFSPSGDRVVMSVSRGGGSDIVTVGLGGGGERRLTNSGAIDTSPCFSADGSQIVFNSDRGGDQQLYIMGADGGGARRISFGAGRYATPVWSPKGDLIAFTRLNGGTFSIGVMHPDGTGERILSTNYLSDGPTFCPNGRVLMFWRDSPGHNARLASIDVTGFNEQAVSTSTEASDPAWSPLAA